MWALLQYTPPPHTVSFHACAARDRPAQPTIFEAPPPRVCSLEKEGSARVIPCRSKSAGAAVIPVCDFEKKEIPCDVKQRRERGRGSLPPAPHLLPQVLEDLHGAQQVRAVARHVERPQPRLQDTRGGRAAKHK